VSEFPMKSRHLALLLPLALLAPPAKADFHDWAPTPPMGWNSWDCFATTITESQTKEEANYMAANLKDHGWQYVVVDIQWYEPAATGYDYRKGAALVLDAYGRLQPAVNRFPSAAGGAGFKGLSDYVHGLGLKFGIHLLRGIPRQAVEENLPILGTSLHARDIADPKSICQWNTDMYGVDMSKPGAQAYYDSVFSLIASWGVDYVKVDDISRPYFEHQREIEAIRLAIDDAGRPVVLSLSPGETPLEAGAHVMEHANLWRISDDFWDDWKLLLDQFGRLENWGRYQKPGAWPDADMLPLGVIAMGSHSTKFTRDEQYTLMTLWSIARSPLMFGGDMRKMDRFTLSLLTNDEVIAVNQSSLYNRALFDENGLVAWGANAAGSTDKYVALFNTRETVATVSVPLQFLGVVGPMRARNLWTHSNSDVQGLSLSASLPPHGAALFRLSAVAKH
jgi:alpha-galactosidase